VNIIEFSKRLSENPARIMNLFPQKGVIMEGSDADLIIISESDSAQMIVPTLSDVYNPYQNITSKLKFDYVIISGDVIIENGNFINKEFKGRCLNVKP
jgi:dihydropyrimidinase